MQARTRESEPVQTRAQVEVLDNAIVEEIHEQRSVPSRAGWFSRERLRQRGPFALIFLVGALLRFWQLGEKPLHHDESLHAYYSMQLLHNLEHWSSCFNPANQCYHYDPILHGPFQFHAIALVYQISQWLAAPDHGINTTTVRIAAATLGSLIVFLPYFLRPYLGRLGALLACALLAFSPSMVYFARFAREDIYMAFFTMLLVVALACYVHARRARWLIIAAVAFTLSYATKEATFLTIAVFGSFAIGLAIWEAGSRIPLRARFAAAPTRSRARSAAKAREQRNYLPKTYAPLILVAFALICAPLAKWFFGWMKDTSAYINSNTSSADAIVQNLKSQTLAVLPWLAGAFIILVAFMYLRERAQKREGTLVRSKLAAHIDPEKQPLLDTLVTMPWRHWCYAVIAGVSVFVLLFSVIFTNLPNGIADGIWQGLYYWLQQQQVARGGQPWYYYLLLIPLYEQVGLVFGLAGVVRCLLRPSRFRLFLVYWFLGNVIIYSWAGEKMPWLMIHMTMPMMILAALGLQPLVQHALVVSRQLVVKQGQVEKNLGRTVGKNRQKQAKYARSEVKSNGIILGRAGTVLGVLAALFLIVLTLQNMYQVSYVHYADGPHEMMIYVQTTTDIDIVMNRIEAIDQKIDHGQQRIDIGVTADMDWPFYWYLRDYSNVCFNFPTGCNIANPAVIITGGTNPSQAQAGAPPSSTYVSRQYKLRTWWDEGYKPQTSGGVGPFMWLSYGDNPPLGAQFDPGLAMQNVWQWWWQRKAIGSTAGATDMNLFIRSDMGVNP
jgi:uncharacterized protein (TIGR03663 family)